MSLTILICTHNRADLLGSALASINAAGRPAMPVQILVAANACSDDTVARMVEYQAIQAERGWLPLRAIEVPSPGKSHALNAAIPKVETEYTAFVDDDHRVDEGYLTGIERAVLQWPDAGLYCGRILPDWDGSEPAWVHDEGVYRIYPLPVPRYDLGGAPKTVTPEEGPIPGGGNLVVRRRVFELAGQFSTELGPHGHDLGGGEDSEYVLRAMVRGERCQYAPEIVQHHYVDTERLQLSYLLKKGYQRTRSMARIHGDGRVPLYMWRKLAEYLFHSLFSLSWAKRRFFLVRTAAALGEVQGQRESGHRGRRLDLPLEPAQRVLVGLVPAMVVFALAAWVLAGQARWSGLLPTLAVAGVGTLALLVKGLTDFTQTGPRIREEVLTYYRRYTVLALLRLALWIFILMALSAGVGVLAYYALTTGLGRPWSPALAAGAAAAGIVMVTALQFIRKLRFNPGLLVASMHYRASRLYPLWQWATPGRIRMAEVLLGAGAGGLLLAATWRLGGGGQTSELAALWSFVLAYACLVAGVHWQPEARAPGRGPGASRGGQPNILMIGSDTLRADRLGALGYHRKVTPNIDRLSSLGALFANCYVPCARTAPSLISFLTGTWPHTHGIRDNFVANSETRLKVLALPQLLKKQGYFSAALSDWCGADLGKFSFGFDYTDLPEDQWNMKYLIRQGPKDLRLYLSLFLHNRLGRVLLPEIYYLGGVPQTTQMGLRARRLVSRLTASPQPFLLNVFYSTTHPPFASEWPWYTRFADSGYAGESKFAMAKLTDPFEIIRRQGAPKEEFDLDQIIDLYDGCVAQFDDEVGRMLRHLEACGLAGNTVLIVYSDHGMEFFEHDTWGQGNSAVGDFSPRTPLIVRDPRLPPRGVVGHVVRSIDLTPTLLDLVGEVPGAQMEGTSLKACLDGSGDCPQLDAFNETGIWFTDLPGTPAGHLRYPDLFDLLEVPDKTGGTLALKPEYRDMIIAAKDRMIRSGRWRLTFQPLEDGYLLKLFDVAADPGCQNDLLGQYPEQAKVLWKPLESWLMADPAMSRHLGRNDTMDSSANR
jgi:arylsulfatase A-like enzyme/glycosyltransferase involved in cell wall biosynthesis